MFKNKPIGENILFEKCNDNKQSSEKSPVKELDPRTKMVDINNLDIQSLLNLLQEQQCKNRQKNTLSKEQLPKTDDVEINDDIEINAYYEDNINEVPPQVDLAADLPDLEGIYKYLTEKNHIQSEKSKFSDSMLEGPPPYMSILNSFFQQNLNTPHVRSYEMLLLEQIASIVQTNGVFPTMLEDKKLEETDINRKILYTLRFENIKVTPSDPSPEFCHENGTHYNCDVFGDCIVESKYYDHLARHPPLTLQRHPQHRKRMLLVRFPLMTGVDPESTYDLCGMLITRGKLRTAPCVKGVISDLDIYFIQNDSTVCQIRSTHHDKLFRATSTLELFIKHQVKQTVAFGNIGCFLPFAKTPIHISVIIKALGFEAFKFIHLIRYCAADKYVEHKFKAYELSILQFEPPTQNNAYLQVSKLYARNTLQTGQCQVQNEVLPHLKHEDKIRELNQKLFYLAMTTAKLILSHEGLIPILSRDCWSMTQIVTCANHMGALFRTQFNANMRQAGKTLRRKLMEHHANISANLNDVDLEVVFCEKRISDRTASAAATGIWSKGRNGVTIALNTSNEDAMVLQIRQIYSPLKQTNGGHEEARSIMKDQYGFVDPVNCPDNEDTGFVSEFAMTAMMSPPIPMDQTQVVMSLILAFSLDNVIPIFDFIAKPWKLKPQERFLMDITGAYTHVVKNSDKFIWMFRMMRRNSILDRFVFIADYNPRIIIFCREGLLCRPLIVASRVKDITREMTFEEAIAKGIIEYVSAQEQATLTKIAMVEKDINLLPEQATHVELMQSAFLGLIAGSVFFSNCRQSGRLTLICTQFKQTIRAIVSKNRGQQTSAKLMYAFRNLVTTSMASMRPGSEIGRGTPCVVAIIPTRKPQEDSIEMRQSFSERGGGLASTSLTYISEAAHPKNSSATVEDFEAPEFVLSKKTSSYKHIHPEHGIVPKNTIVDDEAILIAKTQTVAQSPYEGHKNLVSGQNMAKKQNSSIKLKRDLSTPVRKGHAGQIVEAVIFTQPNGRRAKETVESSRPLKIADKLDTDDAMKGVIAGSTPDVDMPWSAQTGIIPDFVFSVLGPLSRMTPSFQEAGIAGKVVSLYGEFRHGEDQQNFEEPNHQKMKNLGDLLHNAGFQRYGKEMMCDGRTGEQIGMAELIILNIQRLNHLCECKIHFRNTGSVDPKTHQPKDGRKQGSGARLSEMELTVLHAYGCSDIAQQRFCDLSDKFPVYICKSCSLIIDELGVDIGFGWCRRCGSSRKIKKVKLSFMVLVLLYHLLALGISSFLEVDDAQEMFVRPIN
jgi:DNA-directed RNA polymerase beta subunit